MSATAPNPAVGSEAENLDSVVQLTTQLQDQINLLGALLDESAKDPDVRQAAMRIACDAGHLWTAASRLAGMLDVHSTADLADRVENGIRALEPIMVGVETLKDTVPEVLDDLAQSGTLQQLAASTAEWIAVMGQARCLLTGDAPSLAARTGELLDNIENWAQQLLVAWETIAGTMPEVLNSETFRGTLLKLTTSIQVWTSVAHEARSLLGHCGGGDPAAAAREIICAVRDAQNDMRADDKKGGGIFGLLKLVFSSQTQYVLRYVIAVAYRVLKTIDAPAK
ncbi:hypothetical protein [Acidihalobacter ferrooxydans]|uniref:Uncharacterized protein n=1 Tax=Acidihalobacter ferrooxydans TaxID=1765967 RepID=A0A1P8UHE8_9GAMM|nr:hypothetical protein [Acidihalobacter ferrooxydans]APZ43181.1 hypothetical protein BW247_08820 [Acidihalobacter ferrooxydans]